MDFRKLFQPVREFYVPSGWQVDKNNVFYLDKDSFENIQCENQRFLAKEFFINYTVFYSKHELLKDNNMVVCVVDAGCRVTDWDNFILEYDINLNVWLKGKKKRTKLIEKTCLAHSPGEAARKLSDFMEDYYNEKYIDFTTGKLKEMIE
ncbi:hypothetical protein [uncultured Shewanella sp.]|uniref:hypothetical protein n=1 Tax=uncultured Shewanella sp. TaxID=173975 RepID=UPI0026340C7C|nr:hypothetical protein [uncultured Shewanella sp.]